MGDDRKELQDLLQRTISFIFFRREWLDTSSIEGGGIIEDKTEHRDNTERDIRSGSNGGNSG